MHNQPLLSPEILVPRLGEVLVEKRLLNWDQLGLAVAEQERQRQAGRTALLGQVLLEMDLIDRLTLDEAITEQILSLRNALQDANRMLEERVRQRTSQLEQAMEKLAEFSRLKANFVSNVSHELRTPLTHIQGYLELILENDLGPVSEEQKRALNVMQRSTIRLAGLIEDLILSSVSEHSQIPLNLEVTDLAALCADIALIARNKATERRLELEFNTPPNLSLVQADREKLTWAINQLLDNAFKFTPAGGKVLLQVTTQASEISIVVSDTGIGIPASRTQEIFEPFHQLDGSSTRQYGGTGLGLALVKKIIEAHGSTILVDSEENVGSQFRFSLAALGAEPLPPLGGKSGTP